MQGSNLNSKEWQWTDPNFREQITAVFCGRLMFDVEDDDDDEVAAVFEKVPWTMAI